MEKARREKLSRSQVIAITVIVALFIFAELVLLMIWEKNTGMFPEHDVNSGTIRYEGVEYVLKENVETFLVLGLDKFEDDSFQDSYNNDKQADFIMLFVIDNAEKTYSAIQINRDSMVNIDVLGVAGNKIDTVYRQIALSHAYGNGKDLSCHNTAKSVSLLLLDTKINHYASLTLDSVAIVNDLVGGVEVCVLDDFSGIDENLVMGETVLLKGEQALTYVRARQGLDDNTNISRMKRQQQYVKALFDAFDNSVEMDSQFIIDASLKLSECMVSDRSVTQLQVLVEKFCEYEFLGIRSLEGESVVGEEYMEFYPDKNATKKLVVETFYTPKIKK